MAQSAQLGADELILARRGRREVQRDHQAGDEVLLDAQFGDIEGMVDVLRVHPQLHRLVDGNHQAAHHDVVPRCRVVGGIEAEEVLGGIAHQLGMHRAELPIGARVAEIECELFTQDLDLQRAGRRRRLIDVGPHFGAHEREDQDFDTDQHSGKDHQGSGPTGEALDYPRLAGAEAPHEQRQRQLPQNEQGARNDHRLVQLTVDPDAVGRNIRRQPPHVERKDRG